MIPCEWGTELIEYTGCLYLIDRSEFLIFVELIAESVQYLQPKGMEGVYGNTVRILPYDLHETLSHIAGSIVCEGETEYIARIGIGLLEYRSYTDREQLSLTTSWSGDHEHWAIYRLYSFTLARIERCEDGFEIFHVPIL